MKILSLPEYFVFQELKEQTRKVNDVCKLCPPNTILFDYYRIVEDKDDFLVLCKHKARKLKTHVLCNYCGVRYFKNGVIVKHGKYIYPRISQLECATKFKCFLCNEKKKIIDKIT